MNKKMWNPNGSDVNETNSVFDVEIEELIKKVNTYWYYGDAKNQSINIIINCLEKRIKDAEV